MTRQTLKPETCAICGKPIEASLTSVTLADGQKVCGACLGQSNDGSLAFWNGRGWLGTADQPKRSQARRQSA